MRYNISRFSLEFSIFSLHRYFVEWDEWLRKKNESVNYFKWLRVKHCVFASLVGIIFSMETFLINQNACAVEFVSVIRVKKMFWLNIENEVSQSMYSDCFQHTHTERETQLKCRNLFIYCPPTILFMNTVSSISLNWAEHLVALV